MLRGYLAVRDWQAPARFLLAKSLSYEEKSQEVHCLFAELLEGERWEPEPVKDSLLERKLDEARKVLAACEFCELCCKASRLAGQPGACGCSRTLVASVFVHWGEESVLVPSYTVFFSGCNFRCVYCQNWDISQQIVGTEISPAILARRISRLRRAGEILNVNFVGGEPTPHIAYILEVLLNLDVSVPVIFNTNMYLSEKALKILDGVVDLWLPDFKYGNNHCAEKYSGIKKYWETVTRNLLFVEGRGDILVRHLVLPNHVECCSLPVISWLAEQLSLDSFCLNVMEQYYPCFRAREFPELARRITREEYLRALQAALARKIYLIK
ncbi:MAG: radical SAM protein [bacterium]|nr:radical SAM protein [bacterium]